MIGNGNSVAHPSPGVIPKVQNQSPGSLRHNVRKRSVHLCGAVSGKFIEADVSHIFREHTALHPVNVHLRTIHRKGKLLAVSFHHQGHRLAGMATHDVHSVVERVDCYVQVIHLAQNVALMNACFPRRTVVKYAADGTITGKIGARNLDSHTGIVSLIFFPQLSIVLRRVVEGVGITQAI